MTATFPYPPQPLSAKRQLRKAVVRALKASQLTVGASLVTVDSPGVWPYPQQNLPAIAVRSATETKTSISKGNTDFTTSIEVDVRAAVTATTAEAAQDGIEVLWYQIERSLLFDYHLQQLVQSVSSIDSAIEVKADGQMQIGGVIGRFRFETFETFDVSVPEPPRTPAPSVPNPIVPLDQVTGDMVPPVLPLQPQPGDPGFTLNLSEND